MAPPDTKRRSIISTALEFLVAGFAAALLALPGLAQAAHPSSNPVLRQIIQQRLSEVANQNAEREATLRQMFEGAGCFGDHLTEQPVPHSRLPNLVCERPGATDSIILVGAHFDKVKAGAGVVDNWSGASLLPSLFQSLGHGLHRHTFVFVGFTDEERGLVGSRYFVGHLTLEQRARIHAMINLDTLGLGPTKVFLAHSDARLAETAETVARQMNLPVEVYNVRHVDDDSQPFRRARVPTLMIHSATAATLRILHSPADQMAQIRFDDYYYTYGLLAECLAFIDAEHE
ncbi:MAG: M28 family metallopeptidase [Terriglobia bacterium]